VEPAGRADRALAKSLDGLIVGLPVLIGGAGYLAAPDSSLQGPLITLTSAAFFMLLSAQVWLLSTAGQTMGKRLLKLRIVRLGTGEPPGFGRAVALRCWANALLTMIPFYSLLDVLFIFREDRRCIHDLLAGTEVVKL
jgi:uncharacterized RDD family membrane protein YckC